MRVVTTILLLLSLLVAVSCSAKVDTYGRQHQQADKAFGEMK